jgi:DNA mismatch repair protein MutL
MQRIHLLSPETSRLIAAGEVIERPASALRELIDNAIDAQASEIRIELQKGGIDLVRVSDNGLGMSRDDLALAILEHATSKIETADDLLTAKTLGFRGEALASIAAVSRLEIVTKDGESEAGWQLKKEPQSQAIIRPVAARQGTTIEARNFFENFPARRQFLKRAVSEALQCRSVFTEKAMAHPHIVFSIKSGDSLEQLSSSSLADRVAALHPDIPFPSISFFEQDLGLSKISLVYADPSQHRRDRRYLQVFVNCRRVPEWGLAGILDYAFADYLPGGMHPIAFLFLEIDPSHADFNIHPAKREVRIKGLEEIKNSLLQSLKLHFRKSFGDGPPSMSGFVATQVSGRLEYPMQSRNDSAFWEKVIGEGENRFQSTAGYATQKAASRNEFNGPQSSYIYLGRAFGPFILFSMNEILYILDQHAAHERILYDELSSKTHASQPLLVPFIYELGSEADETRFEILHPELERIGFRIQRFQDTCIVQEVPGFLGDKAIPALMEVMAEEADSSNPGSAVLATMACRAAVKDGDCLDDAAAKELIEKSLALPFPRCPHGRPIWISFDRQSLYRMVGRLT